MIHPQIRSDNTAPGGRRPRRLPGEAGWLLDYPPEEARRLGRSRSWLAALTGRPAFVWSSLVRWVLRTLPPDVKAEIARDMLPHFARARREAQEGGGRG